ncbi:heterokaryon incompatibility protein-domain-containing protein [Jackrogersella minutella]|nr:heterokaryon incompatibility protein-domain-containing protein [Jackrogersella minutella]
MTGRISYLCKLALNSLSASFWIKIHPRYQYKVIIWLSRTTNVVVPTPPDEDDLVENRYKYEQLPDKQHVRLLELHPGYGVEPLCGTIRTVPLDSVQGSYDALSYTWGNTRRSGSALINLGDGQNIRLTPSLSEALRQLRRWRKRRILWVDAICMNQWDGDEMSERIPLMLEVYTKCKSVLLWLGLATSHSELGMDILWFLAHTRTRVDKDSTPWNRENPAKVEAALKDIFDRPGFTRFLVVLEAAIAPRVVMRVGRFSVPWSKGAGAKRFLDRIKLMEMSPSWHRTSMAKNADFAPVCELLEFSLMVEARRTGIFKNPSFLDTVHLYRHRKATDQRDHFYALRGLFLPEEIAGFEPDYKISLEETFRRFYNLIERTVLKEPKATPEHTKKAGGLSFGRLRDKVLTLGCGHD